jgi:hypothetical protein
MQINKVGRGDHSNPRSFRSGLGAAVQAIRVPYTNRPVLPSRCLALN